MGLIPSDEDAPSLICRNCDQTKERHTDGKCLFEATDFTPKTVGELTAEASRLFREAMDASGLPVTAPDKVDQKFMALIKKGKK